MSADLDEKENDAFNPASNVAEDDYREKFDPSSPRESVDEGRDSGVDIDDESGFNYTGDKDRDSVAEREGRGSSTGSDAAVTESTDLDNHLGSSWKTSIKGKKSRLKGLLSSKTKVAFAAGGGMTAIAGLVSLMLFLIPLTSFMSLQQLSTILKAKRMANVHYSSYRRLSQYMTEESLSETPTIRSRLTEKFNKFNPAASMKNLNEDGLFTFNTEEGKTRWLRRPTSTVKSISIGAETIDIPPGGFRGRISSAESKAFIKKVDSALSESEALAGKSRYFRTKVANKIFASDEIKLSRWALKGRKIKTLSDAAVSLYESIKPGRLKSSIPDVSESADRFDDGLADALESAKTADDVGDSIAKLAAESVKENKVAGAARTVSLAALIATIYCMGHDYIDQKDAVAKNKGVSAIRSAVKLDSTVDQSKFGDATAQVIDFDANLNAHSEESRAYQDGVGTDPLLLAQKAPDLDESDAPTPDTTSPVAKIFQNTIGLVENIGVGPAKIGNVTGPLCSAINSRIGIILVAGTEIIGQIAAAIISGGASAAGEAATKEGVEEVVSITFREAVKKLGAKEASKIAGQEVLKYAKTVASMKAIEFLIFFGVDKLMGTNTSAVDTAQARAAKNDMGYKMLGNETSLASGGRPLSGQEVAELRQMDRETRLASLHKKPLWYRLASTSNPYSVASRLAVSYPKSPTALFEKGRDIALGGINPTTTLAKSYSGISTALLPTKTAYAAVDEKNDINEYKFQSIGFSKAELDKMLDDQFWPRENAAWMETSNRVASLDEKYGPCFAQLAPGEVNVKEHYVDGVNVCSPSILSGDEALHYRLYLMDGGYGSDNPNDRKDYRQGLLGQLLDLQDVTKDAASSSSGGGNGNGGDNTSAPGEITSDSTTTPCAANTDDLGVRDDAYSNGNRIRIRICAINSIPGTSEESTGGVPGANGRAIVSSIASDAWQRLGEAARAAGVSLSAGSSWRTMAHQEQLCRDDKKNGGSGDCPNGNYNDVAQPGYSNHQAGTAIDIAQIFGSVGGIAATGRACNNPETSTNPTYTWVAANAKSFGIKNYANEAWHWGTSEAC